MRAETIKPARALTVAQAAREVVTDQTREMRRYGKRAVEGRDPEAVHQTRVATRRLRAALRVFRGHLEVPDSIARGLRRVARRLGAVRDQDVLIALAEGSAPALGRTEKQRLSRLVARWRRSREKARAELVEELDRKRHGRLLKALLAFAENPRAAGHHDTVAARVLAEAVESQAERIARHPGMVLAAPEPDALHDLRIGFKRLRYTLDFHAAAFGLSYDAERRLARRMQEVLGEIHDRDLLLDRLTGGKGHWRGPWPELQRRLASERQALVRKFLRLRREWKSRTGAVDEPEAGSRFASLQPARVTLRLVTGGKHVASRRLSGAATTLHQP
jgi:CHAD domain-containing protein